MARRTKAPKTVVEPQLDDLAKDVRVKPGNKGNAKTSGKDVIHGTISTLVREYTLKNLLDRQQRAKDVQVVLGKGGENLELFAKDIAKGYEQTKKEKLAKDKTKVIKDAKVVLKKVNETTIY